MCNYVTYAHCVHAHTIQPTALVINSLLKDLNMLCVCVYNMDISIYIDMISMLRNNIASGFVRPLLGIPKTGRSYPSGYYTIFLLPSPAYSRVSFVLFALLPALSVSVFVSAQLLPHIGCYAVRTFSVRYMMTHIRRRGSHVQQLIFVGAPTSKHPDSFCFILYSV